MKRAFTLPEIIISVAILLALSTASAYFFLRANLNEQFIKDRDGVITTLERARSLSLSSKEAVTYGVHFEPTKIVIFKGDTYNASDPDNIEFNLNSNVEISAINLNDSGTETIFSRLTGETDNPGTVTISRIDDPSSTFVITILNTGVIK